MKRTLLFFACVLSSITMQAQVDSNDYIPFVELGKQWHVVSTDANPNYVHRPEKYWMFEKVERDGKTYVHTYLLDDVLTIWQDAGLFREENRRVYKYDENAGKEIMLYDFSLKEGDTFTCDVFNCKVLKQGLLADGPKILSCTNSASADTLETKYRRLRTWTIGLDNGTGEYHEVTTWVEGVGALENTFSPLDRDGRKSCLAYVERGDKSNNFENEFLPFSFCNIYDVFGQIHGCKLPTSGEQRGEYDRHHHLTYELEGDRLHVYGKVFIQCGPNNYAYFLERSTDDPLVHKIEIIIQEASPQMDCMDLYDTDFYVSGFDPNLNYIVVDNYGEEHPVINKTPQMVYRPFIEESKVWKVGGVGSNPVQMVEYYYFDGDTIIDGKACKLMMRQRFVAPSHSVALSYEGAWYEEGEKVFTYDETNKQFRLMYDFSVEAYDTLMIDNNSYLIGSRQTGGINAFKGVYRDVVMFKDGGLNVQSTPWLEGVGGLYGMTTNVIDMELADPAWFLMSCTVGDEVIYLNDAYEDGATPEALVRKDRIDFTHTIKIKPKTRMMREAEPSLYGEYSEQQLGINLNPLDDAYMVRITDDTGKAVYEKTVNAGSIVGLNIDISAYAKGRYTVTVENSNELFTGQFETQTTGIEENVRIEKFKSGSIYNLQGQRINSLRKGLNIMNGQKIFVK